jgi:hypothetical protein
MSVVSLDEDTTVIPNQKDYGKRVEDLRIAALQLSCILVQYLPERLTPAMRDGSGATVLNWNLKTIADSIDVVLYEFTHLQRTLGLPDDADARYSEVVQMARALKPRTDPPSSPETAPDGEPEPQEAFFQAQAEGPRKTRIEITIRHD